MIRGFFAQSVGRPVIDGVLWVVRALRARAYADLEGRHYQFGTNPIDIVEGGEAERWLRLSHVRRSVEGLPRDATLRRLHPGAVRDDPRAGARIEARALAAVLAPAQDRRTRKFLHWLEREVIFPAGRRAALRRDDTR